MAVSSPNIIASAKKREWVEHPKQLLSNWRKRQGPEVDHWRHKFTRRYRHLGSKETESGMPGHTGAKETQKQLGSYVNKIHKETPLKGEAQGTNYGKLESYNFLMISLLKDGHSLRFWLCFRNMGFLKIDFNIIAMWLMNRMCLTQIPWDCWFSIGSLTTLFNCTVFSCASHSSTLAWRIPGTGEPGGLPPMGSHKAGHDWSDLAAAAVFSSGTHALFSCKR